MYNYIVHMIYYCTLIYNLNTFYKVFRKHFIVFFFSVLFLVS